MLNFVAVVKKNIGLLRNDLSRNHSNYIFFVTSKCNQACEFCFYRDSINKSPDLSLEEIKLLSLKMGDVSNVLFSGGEPILRKDLLDIIDLFVVNNKMKSLTIPSNGMVPELICGVAKNILNKYPEIILQVCISLDGTEKLHDKLRGIKGAYKNAMESIKTLEKLAKQNKKLSFNINTVINPANILLMDEIIQEVKCLGMKCYTHSFEIARPKNISDKNFLFEDVNKLKKVYNEIIKYKDSLYCCGIKGSFFEKLILGALHYANIYSLYKIQYDYLIKGKKWPIQCCAGLDNNVIYNNGDIAICELQKPIGNIKNIPKEKRLSDVFEEGRSSSMNCCCTHICYVLLSMYKSKKMILGIMPVRAIRYFFAKIKLIDYF
ncbi:MAG: radical SAM protein [Candidatus Omnitrophica bacterium]|nr:radical SAM protein [Candidatus Omnitrophota bacterium]